MENFKSHRIQYGWPAQYDSNIVIRIPGTDAEVNKNIEKF